LSFGRVAMQLSLNIPDFTRLALNESVNELSKTIKFNTVLMLLEQASEFASLSIYQFINECKKNKISIVMIKRQKKLLKVLI